MVLVVGGSKPVLSPQGNFLGHDKCTVQHENINMQLCMINGLCLLSHETLARSINSLRIHCLSFKMTLKSCGLSIKETTGSRVTSLLSSAKKISKR